MSSRDIIALAEFGAQLSCTAFDVVESACGSCSRMGKRVGDSGSTLCGLMGLAELSFPPSGSDGTQNLREQYFALIV